MALLGLYTLMPPSKPFDFVNCQRFAGTQKTDIPSIAANEFGAGDFTIAFWFNPTALTTSNNRTIIGKYKDANNYFSLFLTFGTTNASVSARIVIDGTPVTFNTVNVPAWQFSANSWGLYFFTRQSNQAFFYKNDATTAAGSFVSFFTGKTMATFLGLPWQLGGTFPTTMTGNTTFHMDSLMFFNSALTQAERSFLFNGGNGNSCAGIPNVVGCYGFDHPNGSAIGSPGAVVTDSILGNHGTPSGYATAVDFFKHDLV